MSTLVGTGDKGYEARRRKNSATGSIITYLERVNSGSQQTVSQTFEDELGLRGGEREEGVSMVGHRDLDPSHFSKTVQNLGGPTTASADISHSQLTYHTSLSQTLHLQHLLSQRTT